MLICCITRFGWFLGVLVHGLACGVCWLLFVDAGAVWVLGLLACGLLCGCGMFFAVLSLFKVL